MRSATTSERVDKLERLLRAHPTDWTIFWRQLARVPAAEANVLLTSEPMWTAVLSFALLSERLGAHEAIGGALIVGAALFASSDS